MRHSVFGRKLSRTKNERKRLFAGLARDVILRDRITTTIAKAKAVQPLLEQLVTKAKEGSEHSRKNVLAVIADKKIVAKLFEDAKTRFSDRASGFTRIVKLGMRRGDATETAILTFVDDKTVVEQVAPKKTTKTLPVKTEIAKATVESKKTPVKKTAAKKSKKA